MLGGELDIGYYMEQLFCLIGEFIHICQWQVFAGARLVFSSEAPALILARGKDELCFEAKPGAQTCTQ